jgi:hypothetical protein
VFEKTVVGKDLGDILSKMALDVQNQAYMFFVVV